ncbi:MAG: hypothetical protein ACJ8GN_26085 [Longimicrobiaceae bacterium]
MSALLSAISGQFTRALIFGALFPAAIFVLLWMLFVSPLLPPGLAIPAPHLLGKEWDALSVTFVTLVVTGLLYVLDIPLMQLYEGYPWQKSMLGRWRTRVQVERMRAERRRAAVIFELTEKEGTAGRNRLLDEWTRTRRELPMDWPDRDDLVLPTRLGNVMRAFERYPSVQYEIDAIYFWPRMMGVIEPDYASALDAARTSFVFLLNLSFVTGTLAVVILLTGLAYLPPGLAVRVFLPAAVAAFLSVWFYGRMIEGAKAWGEMVKGAFDLYRGKLLEKMGYSQKPRTRDEERALWRKITLQVIFGDRSKTLTESHPRVDYVDSPAPAPPHLASTTVGDTALGVSRGVRRRASEYELDVVVTVANPHFVRVAKDVVVTDPIPAGFEYAWGSARVNGATVPATGINPYHFELGDLPPGASLELSYTTVRTGPTMKEAS